MTPKLDKTHKKFRFVYILPAVTIFIAILLQISVKPWSIINDTMPLLSLQCVIYWVINKPTLVHPILVLFLGLILDSFNLQGFGISSFFWLLSYLYIEILKKNLLELNVYVKTIVVVSLTFSDMAFQSLYFFYYEHEINFNTLKIIQTTITIISSPLIFYVLRKLESNYLKKLKT